MSRRQVNLYTSKRPDSAQCRISGHIPALYYADVVVVDTETSDVVDVGVGMLEDGEIASASESARAFDSIVILQDLLSALFSFEPFCKNDIHAVPGKRHLYQEQRKGC